MHRLLLLGLNHTTAPLEVREKLAFNAAQRREAVRAFKGQFPNCEAVLLSTCNRVELYLGREAHGHPGVKEAIEFLAGAHSVPPGQFDEHLYQKKDREVVDHLFTVTSSLDSMVLGETQIIGQVREAYDSAREAGAAGALLHPLFQRALNVGKLVMHETAIAEGRLSVASVAVEYARRIFETFHDKTVLLIGAGKMAALAMQSFVALRPRRLLVCNRDPAKAQLLAQKFSGQAAPFERLSDHLVAADIVVTSTGATHPIITKPQFESLRRRRRYRPIFLIDIAVPRDVEASVGEIDNVYLYNLDDLQTVVAGTQSQRKGAIEAAKLIVARQVEEFAVWHRQREAGPVIDRLYKHYHRLAQEELARTLNKLPNATEADKAQLEDLTRRIVNKLLNGPVQTLKKSDASHGPAGPYLHAMEKLFGLGEEQRDGNAEAERAPPQTGEDGEGK